MKQGKPGAFCLLTLKGPQKKTTAVDMVRGQETNVSMAPPPNRENKCKMAKGFYLTSLKPRPNQPPSPKTHAQTQDVPTGLWPFPAWLAGRPSSRGSGGCQSDPRPLPPDQRSIGQNMRLCTWDKNSASPRLFWENFPKPLCPFPKTWTTAYVDRTSL